MARKWQILLGVSAAALLLEVVSAPVEWLWPKRWGGSTHYRGHTDRERVALTFDDGPSEYTPEILDILERHGAPATFFVIGERAESRPEILERMAAERHEIGNHTYSFGARAFKLFAGLDEAQIAKTQRIVEASTWQRPRYFRSPGAQMGRNLWNDVRKHDLTVVNGTLPIPSPSSSAEAQMAVLESAIRPGAILILHDGDDGDAASTRPRSTVRLLPMLLEELDARGYEIAPLTTLLRD